MKARVILSQAALCLTSDPAALRASSVTMGRREHGGGCLGTGYSSWDRHDCRAPCRGPAGTLVCLSSGRVWSSPSSHQAAPTEPLRRSQTVRSSGPPPPTSGAARAWPRGCGGGRGRGNWEGASPRPRFRSRSGSPAGQQGSLSRVC